MSDIEYIPPGTWLGPGPIVRLYDIDGDDINFRTTVPRNGILVIYHGPRHVFYAFIMAVSKRTGQALFGWANTADLRGKL